MELFSMEWLVALLGIILIDLVLAGDNAIVIGMAARNVPKEQQKKVILWGTVGAIVIRAVATLAVVWLLQVPGLRLFGGLLLVWIAYKLLAEDKKHDITAKDNLWAAIRTIIIADAAMGIDNVLAVGAAAHGSFSLVIIGLLVSVPIMVWGSTLILGWMTRFPIIVFAGAGVLAFTAAKMITDEPMLHTWFAAPALKWLFVAVVLAGVLLLGRRKQKAASLADAEA
ncbi:TerC family protein [Paenibacillus sp. y28]|uniref:TerC family protein n=1 Tax=Paenibacillus sp. y28 TaxID=3129110 RepID=UPI003016B14A